MKRLLLALALVCDCWGQTPQFVTGGTILSGTSGVVNGNVPSGALVVVFTGTGVSGVTGTLGETFTALQTISGVQIGWTGTTTSSGVDTITINASGNATIVVFSNAAVDSSTQATGTSATASVSVTGTISDTVLVWTSGGTTGPCTGMYRVSGNGYFTTTGDEADSTYPMSASTYSASCPLVSSASWGIIGISLKWAQGASYVYLRSGPPQSQPIIGCTNATPVVCQTSVAHGFSNSCNTTNSICYCNPTGVVFGAGPSAVQNVRECVPTDTTHLAIYDFAGNPVVGNGDWWGGNTFQPNIGFNAQWVGLLTQYIIPSNPGPLGWFDGTNGDALRRMSTGPASGLTSIVVSGGSGSSCASVNCVVTINLSYNPLTLSIPVAAGQNFSVTGTYTGSGADLDTCGVGGGAQSPFTIASVTASTIVSTGFTCAGLTTGTYTGVHMACGPSSPPNDLIGGTQDCARFSLIATTNNPEWNQLLSQMSTNNLLTSPNYKFTYDGGVNSPTHSFHPFYAMAGIRFLVDPTVQLWLTEIIYSLDHDYRSSGIGYTFHSLAWVGQSNSDYNYSVDMEGLAQEYAIAAHAPEGRYWAESDWASYLERLYADMDDTTIPPATVNNQDMAVESTHNFVLSSGLLAVGTNDATHAQLPNTDPNYSTTNYYVNTIIYLVSGNSGLGNNWNTNANTWGLVTAQSNAGVLTIGGGWQGASETPTLGQTVNMTYTSGLTCTGTTGQYVFLQGPGGFPALIMPLTGTNTIASGTQASYFIYPGDGSGSPPTSWTVLAFNSQANCSGTATLAGTLGTQYTIFDTVTTSSSVANATATVTWNKTSSLSGLINVGDGITATNSWPTELNVSNMASYVTAVGSNSVTVINVPGGGSPISTTFPQIAWRIPQYTAGDTGRLHATRAQQADSIGGQPAIYGPGGGAASNFQNSSGVYITDNWANGSGATVVGWYMMDMAAAQDDPRAVRDIARWGGLFDNMLRPVMDFSTGRGRYGAGYTNDNETQFANNFIVISRRTVPSYPILDADVGLWSQNRCIFSMFDTEPAFQGNTSWFGGWGGSGWGTYSVGGLTGYGITFNGCLSFSPTATRTRYFVDWLNHNNPSFSLYGSVEADSLAMAMTTADPRVPTATYTGMPTQSVFNVSEPNLTTLTGWPNYYRGDIAYSRSAWVDQSHGVMSMFQLNAYSSPGGVYDGPTAGNVAIWSLGCLIGLDSNPCNQATGGNPAAIGDMVNFAGTAGFQPGEPPTQVGFTYIYSWTQNNAGSLGPQFGDASSRWAAACGNIAPNYNQTALGITIGHANQCWVHMKNLTAGHDQFILDYRDIAVTSGPTQIEWNLQYSQNGATQNDGTGRTTGSTTALGGNVIEELQDGLGSPAQNGGLLTYVRSPGTFSLVDQCIGIGGGQCNGASYPGGNGHSHKFAVCAGASCTATANSLVTVVCHKYMNGLSDTTFTHTDLDPDANWTGVVCGGANSNVVGVFARNTLQSVMTSFNTTFSGPGDWIIEGLSAGVYSVTVGGTPVSGNPFTVGATDNSIPFSTSGSGLVSLQLISSTPASVNGPKMVGSGTVGH